MTSFERGAVLFVAALGGLGLLGVLDGPNWFVHILGLVVLVLSVTALVWYCNNVFRVVSTER